ncbi:MULTISPECIES: GNAT family N-acetyltransferase [unclassified Rathayibacter]|uniref:GNAT family N-acetyltransferase n=1 Tax=unclassified Rathayibacter TaxID=2609250 RepID=UPI001889DE5A|nr:MULTISPECIES: GNAT family N-acetyltransferase [unclassified Rathayibacter]MBF4462985.1 GNAT family N-acetyltransferase [Rathayibacter sp. VKM Ac-2879]MBF4504399.1 GNAT family N-acetyltransferase [Rathayibacter sp. VKM Ac-2878]
MSVRRAVASDAERLAELAGETFPLACPPHTTAEAKAEFIRTVLSSERFRGYLADPMRSVLVEEDGSGALDGYTMLVRVEPSDPDVRAAISSAPSVELSKFYTRSERHGSGLAARLMAATLEEARASGAAGVWLGVNQENGRAQRFYLKHGFAVVGRKRFLVGDRHEDDFVLERPLP